MALTISLASYEDDENVSVLPKRGFAFDLDFAWFFIQMRDSVKTLKLVNATGTAAVEVLSVADNAALALRSIPDNKVITLNSRNYVGTTGSNIGVQIKPAVTVTKTSDGLTGLEVSPRVNSGVAMAGASGTVIAIHADVYLKGTATGTVAGDVRALNLEQVTDDAATRTVSGNVNHIRIRSAWSGTISGKFVPIRIEKAEAQTGSKQYDAVLDLPSTNAGVWHDDPNTEPSTAAGYIKVLVNGNARYIQLYSTAPTD